MHAIKGQRRETGTGTCGSLSQSVYWHRTKRRAGVTQLVECLLPKQNVVGSSPITRSNFPLYSKQNRRTHEAVF